MKNLYKKQYILSKSPGYDSGFTLVEVLIAIFLLSVGLLAVATLQSTALKTNGAAMKITTAMEVAQEAMEGLMRRSYTDDSVSQDTHTEASPPAGHTITWVVTDNNPVSGTKRIVMTVTYPGMKQPLVLTSLKPRFISP